MIRKIDLEDARAITTIYNKYVTNSTTTFETEPVAVEGMRERITQISANFLYFVYEIDNEVVGYYYAHLWKERVAYRYTLETTVYLSTEHIRKGIGRLFMQRLIKKCRESGYRTLIACITKGNETSYALHVKLSFKRVAGYRQVGWKLNRWLGVVDYELLLIPQSRAIIKEHNF